MGNNEKRLEEINKIQELNKSGYAGIMGNGQIVDRRDYPNAVAVPANKLFGVIEPKPVDTKSCNLEIFYKEMERMAPEFNAHAFERQNSIIVQAIHAAMNKLGHPQKNIVGKPSAN